MSSDISRVVFIDTNLDTHLAFTVFNHDTVLDVKSKILSEHPACFPKFGQILIHAIKVKRKEHFYHLSDSMLVRSAILNPINKSWFLSADVSVLGENRQNEQLFSDRVGSLAIANNNALVGFQDNAVSLPFNSRLLQRESEQIPIVRHCVSERTAKEVVPNREVPSSHIECEVDGSGKGNRDEPSTSVQSVRRKKKSRKRKKKDSVGGDTSRDNIASVDSPPLSCERASSFNNFPVPRLENKQAEKEEIQGQHTEKKALEMDVKSFDNNDLHELLNSLVECEVDGSNKGTKEDCIVGEERTSKPAPSAPKNHKSKKRKKEDNVRDDTSTENDTNIVPDDYTVQQDVVVQANTSENAVKEVIKETEVLKEHPHTECNDNNTKSDIDVVLVKEASEPKSATVTKKHKKRKTHDYKELKVETASHKDAAQISLEAHQDTKESQGQSVLIKDKSGDDVEYKHNKTEDTLDTSPPAKKRKKSKKNRGEKTLSNEKLADDLNGDNSSPNLLKDLPNIKNRSADQLAQKFDDADQLETSMLGPREEGKMSSSDLEGTPIVTFKIDNEEGHHSSIQREDIAMSKMTVDKMEIGADACKVSIQPTMKGKGSDKNHCGIEMNVQSSDVNEPKYLTNNNENVVPSHCNDREAGQTEAAEERKEVSTSNQGNTNADIKELETISNVVDVNGISKPVKSEKKNRGTKKAKNSGGEVALREAISPVDASESETLIAQSLKATICDPALENTEIEENPFNQTEGEKIQQEEMPGTVLSVTDKGTDFSADNAGSLEHIKTKSNAENVDEHVDKRVARKSNNKRASTPKSSPKKVTKAQVPASKKEHDVPMSQPGKKVPNAPRTREDFSADKASSLEHIKTKSNAENVDEHLDKRVARKSNNKRASTPKSSPKKVTKAQVPASKKEHDVQMFQPGKKVPNAPRTRQGLKLSSRSDSVMSSIEENRKPRYSASGKSLDLEGQRGEHIPISKSKLKGSNKMAQSKARKAPRNNVGRVVSKTQQKKSVIGEAIFNDDSSSTSEGEDQMDNSDASTRTPTDGSLLSDFSDVDSQQNGSGGKGLENGERSSVKASLSGTKGMSIDHILRSSTRYKKSKITASQMDESESQPELVPDSLPC